METVVVVEWAEGFHEVADGSGRRREIAWPAKDALTIEAAQAVGEAALVTLGLRDSVSVAAEDWPEWPVLGNAYSVAGWDGTASTQRLVAMRLGMDRNGFATVVPTFSSPEEEIIAAQKVAIETLTTGGVSVGAAGMSAPGELTKTVPTGSLSPPNIPPWSTVGGITTTPTSPPPVWPAAEPVIVTSVELLCEPSGPPDDDVAVQVLVGGTLETTLTLPQGETRWLILGGIFVGPGSTLQFAVSDIGANGDLSDLTLTVKPTAATAALRVAE